MNIPRRAQAAIERGLSEQPAVILTGPPRVGRSELAALIGSLGAESTHSFDAALDTDRDQLNSLLAGPPQGATLVVIDQIDQDALPTIDALVRASARAGECRFLLVPRRQSLVRTMRSALTGMTSEVELFPIQPDEELLALDLQPDTIASLDELTSGPIVALQWDMERRWLRGGLPQSLNGTGAQESLRWRLDYLRSVLLGDHSDWGISPEDRLDAVFARIADHHGGQFKVDACASALGIKKPQVERALTALTGMGLIRRLPNWAGGVDVVFIRDTGLHLAQCGIGDLARLRADRKRSGHSWEGFSTEALIHAAETADASFYRDAADNEIDLILDFPHAGRRFAIEFKVGEGQQAEEGFWRAKREVAPTDTMIVHAGRIDFRDAAPPRLTLPTAIREVGSLVRHFK